ncbi:PREDICTED: histone-lysine N-methyltransferase SETMAR-like [Trachymyrmex septentrionalis]|uniref:histone-lysine N-methyltransferase SETMAR-like n=1 Tax=Trachymyrmex septentrionalis TaxID=34720 RepID=UPI00084F7674|nr:PREDICTED: histone-lysine N-methyltransferase SETMAR-like [Trachymyrmex septentrionalis]
MEKKEFRVLIKHCFLMGKNTVEAKQWLDKHYGTSAPGKSTIIDWYADFKRGRTDTDDAHRSGRPNEAVVPEKIKQVHKLVLSDRKLKLDDIADIVKISKGSVFTILHDHLSMRKLCSKWVPRLLTVDQKQQRVDDSESCLAMFQKDRKDFLRRYVTMDETWIHHFTPESNRQSAEWTAAGESRPKRPKTQTSAGKVMASVFWDAHGILFIDYLEKGGRINSEYYMALLTRLKAEIVENRPHMAKKKIIFHQDNAPCHKSMATMVKLNELGFELLPHPPYSPDLAPSDYFLFAELKKMLAGKKFRSDEEVIAETDAYFEGQPKSFYKTGIERLERRWTNCIALKGNYSDE